MRSEEKLMAETLYRLFNARVIELENLEEATNKHQSIYKYVPFMRKAYLCSEYEVNQRTTVKQYIVDT